MRPSCTHTVIANLSGGVCPLCPPVTTRADGWRSATTGIGVVGRDKRLTYAWQVLTTSTADAAAMRAGNDLAARMIEDKPSECWREGFDLQIPSDKDLAEEITAEWATLHVEDRFREAQEYERQFGGSAILIGAIDGSTDLRQPLGAVNELRFLTTLEASECRPLLYYADPRAPKFGEAAIYQLSAYARGAAVDQSSADVQTHEIHESRLLTFPGLRASRTYPDIGVTEPGWGVSILTRVASVLRGFDLTWDAAELLIVDFAQAVMKIEGLAEAIAGEGDKLKDRVAAFNLARSAANVAIIDSKEEFFRAQTPITGLPEMMEVFQARLASAADMPITRLFGRSPAGMNATGESDENQYHDSVRLVQNKVVIPRLSRVVRMQFQTRGIPEPKQWAIVARSLKQESDATRAAGRKVQAEADAIYISNGVVSPDEVRQSRYGGDEYSHETAIEKDETALETAEAAADPAGVVEPTKPTVEEPAKTAMNGAQVSSLVGVIVAAGDGSLPRESAQGVLEVAFGLSSTEAAKLLPPENWEPPSVNPEDPDDGSSVDPEDPEPPSDDDPEQEDLSDDDAPDR